MKPLPEGFWPSIVLSIVLSFLVAAWAIPQADRYGGKHPAVLLFPYSVLAILLGADYHAAVPWLAFVQYPVYVTLLSLAGNRRRMLIRLSVLHAIFVTSCCLLADQGA